MSANDGWDALFGRRTLGMRMGLAIVEGVHAAMGRPGTTTPAVHLVGTNGKGSTAAMIEHGLRRHGLRTGLYTSPHLSRVGERVRIDGQPVADDRLRAHVDVVLAAEARASLPRPLSFFELLTLAALDLLAAATLDVWVVEAGLGGRLDATRVVDPKVVAVTSIGLDHQAILGPTVAAIAAEKAAVMRAGVPTVSAPQTPEAAEVIEAFARRVGSPLRWVEPRPRSPVGLPGEHQRINAGLALAAGRVLVPELTAGDLDGVRWPGRLEVLPWAGGTVVLDVAHNPAGIEAVVEAVAQGVVPRPDRVLFGCQADKDGASMVEQLARVGVPCWWLSPDAQSPPPQAARSWPRRFEHEQTAQALRAVADGLSDGGTVLVCGSHKLVAAVRDTTFGQVHRPDPQDPRPPR